MHLVDVVSVAGSEPIAAVVGAGRTRFGELWYDNPEKRALTWSTECTTS